MSQFWFPNTPEGVDASPAAYVCQACQSPLQRVPRRPQDRVLNWFMPVRRYRCLSSRCQRETNIRVGKGDEQADGSASTYAAGRRVRRTTRRNRPPASFVLAMALAAAGVLFLVIFAAAGWLEAEPVASAYEAIAR